MLVTNKKTVPLGLYDGFQTELLIGETNSNSKEISIQITEVALGGMQFLHSHDEAQCYYIVCGTGLMLIDDEEQKVIEGDAVFIPSRASHGIKNIGPETLVYLTANQAFGVEREKTVWPYPSQQ